MLAVFRLVVFGLAGSVFGWPDQWWFGVWLVVGWCSGWLDLCLGGRINGGLVFGWLWVSV